MKRYSTCILVLSIISILTACTGKPTATNTEANASDTLRILPVVITERIQHDSDDPAIWINPYDTTQVLIVGTDKGGDTGAGGLYLFDLSGKIVQSVTDLKRPNNVDVGYIKSGDSIVSFAVCTERYANAIRIFKLPNLQAIDNGKIPVFLSDSLRDPMGVAIYTAPDNSVYAIVGRKTGPTTNYLHQYRLTIDNTGTMAATFVRAFGNYSGQNEIEAIAVDNEAGYIYYSDEGVGIRKYYAHPDSSGVELALFGTTGFKEDHEGISIYKTGPNSGYILVSDQQANTFRVFNRDGGPNHKHELQQVIPVSTNESDGSDVTSRALPGFPKGIFVAMSDNGTFHYYRWEDLNIPDTTKYKAQDSE